MPTLAPEQLMAQVRQWRQRPRWAEERVFAIRTDLDYRGASQLVIDGLALGVAECRSDLEAREKLSGLGDGNAEGLVLLVRIGHEGIGDDLRGHFAGNQLLSLDPREVLREIFQATSIDPRIVSNPVLLEALLQRGAEGTGRLAPSGALDLDFAWSVLLGMPELANHRPDLVDLLRWSRDASTWLVVESLDEALQPHFFAWASERAGHVADSLAHLSKTHRIGLAVPLGLVVGDLFAKELSDDPTAASARVRLENYFGGAAIDAKDAFAWMRAATEVMKDAPSERLDKISTVVDEILAELKATDLSQNFTWSKQGFRDRWISFADDLDRLPKRKWETGSTALRDSFKRLREHVLANLHPIRMERAGMAARLAIRAARETPATVEPTTLRGASDVFLREDSFIDWARYTLSHGDPVEEVSKVYGRLVQRAAKERTEKQARFGSLLKVWNNESGYLTNGLLPIEHVLDRIVAPLAKEVPVLLLVLDGMNAPVFHQLTRDLANYGWMATAADRQDIPSPVIAALPSLTRVSRWALFAGCLAHGTRPVEAVAFRDHAGLAEVKSKGKPRLFAKGELTADDDAGLAMDVRDTLAGSEHRVVSVLLNVIDDQLATGGQLDVNWTVSGIGVLPSVLDAASQGGRTLIVISDHGHILDLGTVQVKHDGVGESRCRPGQSAGAGEEIFEGDRVRYASGEDSLILPVVETLRYTQKAGGYHGGATDLEVVVPMGVFTQGDEAPAGYDLVDPASPPWWDWESMIDGAESPAPVRKPAPVTRSPRKKTEEELPLFASVSAAVSSSTEPAWLEALFDSPVYASQEERLGRATTKREHVAAVLRALANHHGTILEPTLAKAIGEPTYRIQGILARVSRLLNIDGYEVLAMERESKTVRLNEVLLLKQFDLHG